MTPDDLAKRHPRLFHLTAPDAVDGIRERGLLSTRAICDRLCLDGALRERVLSRRPREIKLEGTVDGREERYFINDNAPLFASKLAPVLDDGLTVADWLAMLNGRVFFWSDRRHAESLRGARNNADRPRVLLVFDTLSLARAHASRIEICPLNSGATLHSPPRRGLETFAAIEGLDFPQWRARRRERGEKKGLDSIKEVTVPDHVPDAFAHVVDVVDS